MVGIVLASHGGFADGIAQSAQLLFPFCHECHLDLHQALR